MVGGVLFTTAGSRRAVVALDATTGEMLWMHSENEGARGDAAPRRLSGRGLAYWTDGREARILYVTPGYRLIALDAKTGTLVAGFGQNGVVDLKLDDDQDMDLVNSDIGLHAAPIVAKDVIIVGAAHLVSSVPKSKANVKGYVRGFDVRTGKRKWIFHTIPLPGEYGNNTWEGDSWSHRETPACGRRCQSTKIWASSLPVELPTGDAYGGHRPGQGLFGESLVAVDLQTGVRKWHYQLIHHGLWDRDIPCAPILVDITVNGRAIKAVAQPTKQGFVYVFDRVTGEPVWPIVERPVPKGDVPGEWYSPTQPFPTKPPAFDRQGVTLDDLIDFTPELKAEAVKMTSRYKLGPLFNPPVVSNWEGPLAALVLPNFNGSVSWPGGSVDPETKLLYVYSFTQVWALSVVLSDGKRSDMRNVRTRRDPNAPPPAGGGGGGGGPRFDGAGIAPIKPPWTHHGDRSQQRRHRLAARTEKHPTASRISGAQRAEHPRSQPLGRIGTPDRHSGCGRSGFTTTPNGQRGAASPYDRQPGGSLLYMPAPQTGSPMTYMVGGRQ
jgi:quinoprotein glucose dehydrogenase